MVYAVLDEKSVLSQVGIFIIFIKRRNRKEIIQVNSCVSSAFFLEVDR